MRDKASKLLSVVAKEMHIEIERNNLEEMNDILKLSLNNNIKISKFKKEGNLKEAIFI